MKHPKSMPRNAHSNKAISRRKVLTTVGAGACLTAASPFWFNIAKASKDTIRIGEPRIQGLGPANACERN